jgi:hypothetical protein
VGTTRGLTTVRGIGTGSLTLSGSSANLNAALGTLVYRGTRNYGGTDTLSVTVSAGLLSTKAGVTITVKSAARQAADLRARVNALQAAGVLSPSLGALLAATLGLQGSTADALRVKDFLSEVRMLRGLGMLNAAQADALLGLGNILLLSVTRR